MNPACVQLPPDPPHYPPGPPSFTTIFPSTSCHSSQVDAGRCIATALSPVMRGCEPRAVTQTIEPIQSAPCAASTQDASNALGLPSRKNRSPARVQHDSSASPNNAINRYAIGHRSRQDTEYHTSPSLLNNHAKIPSCPNTKSLRLQGTRPSVEGQAPGARRSKASARRRLSESAGRQTRRERLAKVNDLGPPPPKVCSAWAPSAVARFSDKEDPPSFPPCEDYSPRLTAQLTGTRTRAAGTVARAAGQRPPPLPPLCHSVTGK